MPSVSRQWDEFEIRRVSDGELLRRIVTDPIADTVFGARTDTTVIFRAERGQRVHFAFPGTRITLETQIPRRAWPGPRRRRRAVKSDQTD